MHRSYKLLDAVINTEKRHFEINFFYEGKPRKASLDHLGSGSQFPLFKVEMEGYKFFHLTLDQQSFRWISLELEPVPDALLFIIGNEIESYFLN